MLRIARLDNDIYDVYADVTSVPTDTHTEWHTAIISCLTVYLVEPQVSKGISPLD